MRTNQSIAHQGVFATASKESYFVFFLVGCIRIFHRIARILFKAALEIKNEPKQPLPMVGPVATAPEVKGVEQNTGELANQLSRAKQALSPQTKDFDVASRVRIANLTIDGNIPVARIWFYLYEEKKIIRRVLRLDDHQLRQIMGCARYYMPNVEWDPKTGEGGIDAIIGSSTTEVVKLVDNRKILRSGKPKGATRKEAPLEPSKLTLIKAEKPIQKVVVPQATEPTKDKSQDANAKSGSQVRESVTRPVEGQEYVGCVAEMGIVDRPGHHGSYKAFCLKLEKNGVHSTFYGVELEREVLEHKVRAGDQVSVIFMGRQELPQSGGQTSFKNLYKVKVIARRGS